MGSDPASSLGLPAGVWVAEDPEESDYEDVEELFEEEDQLEGEEVGGGVEGEGGVEEKEGDGVVVKEVVEETGVGKKDDEPRAPKAGGEVQLEREVGGGVEKGDEVAEKEGDGDGVKGVAEKVGGKGVAKKDDEPRAPKAEAAHDGTKKSEDSGSAIKLVSSTQSTKNNSLSSSQTKPLNSCSQGRPFFQSKCIISSKECGVTRNIGEKDSVKNAKHDKASYSKAHAVLRNRNPDYAVQSLDSFDKTGCQTPKCFGAPSAQSAPRRPSSSLGVDETALKKPAIICDFFAKGWCIKGNSCRFLHMKDGATVAGSMRDVGKSIQPTSYKLVDSGSGENSKDLSDRQRALVRAYGGEYRDLTKTANEYFQGGLGTRPYHGSDFNSSSKEEYQYQQHLKEGASYKEVQRGETHDAPSSGFPFLASSAFHSRNYHSEGSSMVSDPYHSGSINYSNGNCRGDHMMQYGQHPYPPHEYRSYSLTSSVDSSHTNPLSYPHSSPSVHVFSQPVKPIHNSTIVGPEYDNIRSISCDRAYYGSSCFPRISPYYSEHDSRRSEKGISGVAPPSIEQKSAILEHTWETSVPFRSSFCSTSLGKIFPGGQHDPPVVGVEPPKSVATSVSHRSIDHYKMDEYVTGGLTSENFTSGCGELKSTDSFSNRSFEDVVPERTSLHGVSSYPGMLSASQNGSIHEAEISIPENVTHQICHSHDSSIMVKDIGAGVRSEVDNCFNMEPRALRIFRVALIDLVKELIKPAWKEGHISKDAHKIIVKKSVDKVLGTLQLHEVPSNEESINSYLSVSHYKIAKLVEAYIAKYAMVSRAEDFKPL